MLLLTDNKIPKNLYLIDTFLHFIIFCLFLSKAFEISSAYSSFKPSSDNDLFKRPNVL